MTREEAKEALSVLKIYDAQWLREAVDMAIEALTYKNLKKPNNTCEVDLISRADAIEAVGGVVIDEFDVSPTRGYEVAEKALSALPSADAVQGEWIHDGQNFKGGLDWCHCSECGYKTSTNGLSVYRYCPNCGARMEASK